MDEINKFGIYQSGFGNKKKYYTKNLVPGVSSFHEKLIKIKGTEYREFEPKRSKLGAAVAKGLSQTGIKKGSLILYLGASHGFTPSFVSDIIEENGAIFCLDFAPTVVRDLVFLCEIRKNMIPIIADAKKPESYKQKIVPCDVIIQDVAQREQVKIFLDNVDMHLKKGGFGLLALKARSIDVSKKPKQLFQEARKQLEAKYTIVDYRELDPFEKDHAFFVIKKKWDI